VDQFLCSIVLAAVNVYKTSLGNGSLHSDDCDVIFVYLDFLCVSFTKVRVYLTWRLPVFLSCMVLMILWLHSQK